MTVLTLTQAWLLRLDTGELWSAYTDDSSGQPQYSIDGDIVNHAGGRQRAYAVEGESSRWPITFRRLDLDDLAMLRAWKAQPVLYRNHRGEAMYGEFFDVQQEAWKKPGRWNARIELRGITVVEGV
ncbi:hypothetical protein [Actinoplanes sp. N902-109]|uniref:hypothetical protein n=1 Tax=Actinoplanes sp. (strain N902-109) TaxID=649831 RepID=UPI0003293950|nr:hypothetical protein [Actinoplanes sp. N902-109]AGL19495.1 hypothetical protein L083_5985 [Actinoplanes sp. N902-109]